MAISEDYAWNYLKTIEINVIKDARIFISVRERNHNPGSTNKLVEIHYKTLWIT